MVEFGGADFLCTKLHQKRTKKVSFCAQNRRKSNPMHIGSVPCTETGQNEVSKKTTEEVQGANPGILLFENQKNSWSTISWSAVQKTKNAHVSSGKVYIIVDQYGSVFMVLMYKFLIFVLTLSPFCEHLVLRKWCTGHNPQTGCFSTSHDKILWSFLTSHLK